MGSKNKAGRADRGRGPHPIFAPQFGFNLIYFNIGRCRRAAIAICITALAAAVLLLLIGSLGFIGAGLRPDYLVTNVSESVSDDGDSADRADLRPDDPRALDAVRMAVLAFRQEHVDELKDITARSSGRSRARSWSDDTPDSYTNPAPVLNQY